LRDSQIAAAAATLHLPPSGAARASDALVLVGDQDDPLLIARCRVEACLACFDTRFNR
jgi:hypothetical protein